MIAESVAWSSKVSGACDRGRPVVVLESSVIAQGLPWPENLQTARAVEAAVRSAGAEPATVAVLGGVVRIGLSDTQLVEVARAAATGPDSLASSTAVDRPAGRTDALPPRRRWAKANRRDLAPIVGAGRDAATTVSATLWIARRFDLQPRVLATGGLGGVHRDAATSFDISTDLDELARADGALVVCSGLKSILDLPASLEALETRGVLVVGYRTGELPGFLARSCGLPLEHRVDSPGEAAELVRAHRALGLPGAIVLTQQVPEAEALDPNRLRAALDLALDEARRRGIAGKPLTPFLLDAIRHATAGRSLRANCALLAANARLAAEVAGELTGPLDRSG
jgi:pseudouridine-5'-phosphate glycosidase